MDRLWGAGTTAMLDPLGVTQSASTLVHLASLLGLPLFANKFLGFRIEPLNVGHF